LLLAGVGDVLVLARVRFPMQANRAPRGIALFGLILVLANLGWWLIRRPTPDRPDPARADRWHLLLISLGLAFSTTGLLLSHW